MAFIHNPLTNKTIQIDSPDYSSNCGGCGSNNKDKKRPEPEDLSFVQKHPQLARALLVLGVAGAASVVSLGINDLIWGSSHYEEEVEESNLPDFVLNTFCKGGQRATFCP